MRTTGNYNVGDRFDLQSDGVAGGWTGYIVKTAGIRGSQVWLENQGVGTAYYIEPTATGTPVPPTAGGKVFHCTTGGTTDAVEPNWATATVIGNTITEVGGVVWTLIGFVPEYSRIGYIDGGGQTTIAMADSNQTLTSAQAASQTIKATGVLTADRDLRFPAPTGDVNSFERTIRATVIGANLLVDIVGGVAPITVLAGKTAIVGFDAAGAYRVTTDV